MRKLYFLFLSLIASTLSFGQQVVITAYVDSPCPGNSGRTLELYVDGTIDFSAGTGWQLELQTTTGAVEFDQFFSIGALGTVTDDFVYITNDLATFNQEFGVQNHVLENSNYFNGNTGNGDDGFQIVDNTGTVIDRFGVEFLDGTGTAWEYTDSYFTRNSAATPNGGNFDISNWSIAPPGTLDDTPGAGDGICNTGTALGTIVGTGTYEQNPLSVAQNDIEGFHLYPNPVTTGEVTIRTAKNLTKEITVFDVTGKVVLHSNLSGEVLNISALETGVYIIKVTEDRKAATRKLVVN